MPSVRCVDGRYCATTCSQSGISVRGMVAPLSMSIGRYSNCTRIWLSCIEFTTDAMIMPIARNATTPMLRKMNSDTGLCGIGMWLRK